MLAARLYFHSLDAAQLRQASERATAGDEPWKVNLARRLLEDSR